jgi:plastocyanin
MHRSKVLLAAGIVLTAAAAAIAITPSGRSARAATANVTVADNTFTDSASATLTTTITAGDAVLWTWTGSAPHSVTADDNSFDDPAASFKTSGTFSHTFSTPGTYAYYCRVHGAPNGVGMHGVVVVQQAATSTPTNTPTATNTPGATNTPTSTPVVTRTPTTTPAATSTSAPVPNATAATGQPTLIAPPPSGAAAGAKLPAAGAGPHDAAALPVWITAALAIAGVTTLTASLVLRRRAAPRM